MIKHLIITLIIGFQLHAQTEQKAFSVGEQLEYRVHYGPLEAGKVLLKVREKDNNYWFSAFGKSTGVFNFFFKVRDYYESIVDKDCFCPLYFNRNVQEGNYSKIENVFFNYDLHRVESTRDTIPLNSAAQDLVSSFYQLRSLQFDSLSIGDNFPIEIYLDDDFLQSEMYYLGNDIIKTKFGKVNCQVWAPKLETGRVFEDKYGMKIWVSDDKNKVPLKLETKVLVGSIKMDLIKYQGLKNPLKLTE